MILPDHMAVKESFQTNISHGSSSYKVLQDIDVLQEQTYRFDYHVLDSIDSPPRAAVANRTALSPGLDPRCLF